MVWVPELAERVSEVGQSLPACFGGCGWCVVCAWVRVWCRQKIVFLVGLSPRVRGNLLKAEFIQSKIRSIPARAGSKGQKD